MSSKDTKIVQRNVFGSIFRRRVVGIELIFLYRKGAERKVSVTKTNEKSRSEKEFDELPHFTFSEESKRALGDLFAQFPPGDGNLKDMIGVNSGGIESARHRIDDIFSAPSMTKDEITRKLKTVNSRRQTVPKLKEVHFFPFSKMNLVGWMLHCCH